MYPDVGGLRADIGVHRGTPGILYNLTIKPGPPYNVHIVNKVFTI